MTKEPSLEIQEPQAKPRPKFIRSQDPKLYAPVMPPLWLFDHLDYCLRLAWWTFTQRRPLPTLLYTTLVAVITFAVIACGDRAAMTERCPASRIHELVADLQPRSDRLLKAYHRHHCDTAPTRGTDRHTMQTIKGNNIIAGRCKQLTHRLHVLLNSVEGYLLLDGRRDTCTDSAGGITALPAASRRNLETIRSTLSKTLEHSPTPRWQKENFCRAC